MQCTMRLPGIPLGRVGSRVHFRRHIRMRHCTIIKCWWRVALVLHRRWRRLMLSNRAGGSTWSGSYETQRCWSKFPPCTLFFHLHDPVLLITILNLGCFFFNPFINLLQLDSFLSTCIWTMMGGILSSTRERSRCHPALLRTTMQMSELSGVDLSYLLSYPTLYMVMKVRAQRFVFGKRVKNKSCAWRNLMKM